MEIFVFGSNTEGRHGAGTALAAKNKHGAKYGQAKGLQGNSYAIVTKELRKDHPKVTLREIELQVENFIDFAKKSPAYKFVITKIGGDLAGFNWE
jgi:hypothetical protein